MIYHQSTGQLFADVRAMLSTSGDKIVTVVA